MVSKTYRNPMFFSLEYDTNHNTQRLTARVTLKKYLFATLHWTGSVNKDFRVPSKWKSLTIIILDFIKR